MPAQQPRRRVTAGAHRAAAGRCHLPRSIAAHRSSVRAIFDAQREYDVRICPPVGTLASWVLEFVETSSWVEAGGQGLSRPAAGEPIVQRTGWRRAAWRHFGRLRAARELPRREKLDPRLVAANRVGRGPGRSSIRQSRQISTPAKLSDIRDQLEASTATHLLIDQVMLARSQQSSVPADPAWPSRRCRWPKHCSCHASSQWGSASAPSTNKRCKSRRSRACASTWNWRLYPVHDLVPQADAGIGRRVP